MPPPPSSACCKGRRVIGKVDGDSEVSDVITNIGGSLEVDRDWWEGGALSSTLTKMNEINTMACVSVRVSVCVVCVGGGVGGVEGMCVCAWLVGNMGVCVCVYVCECACCCKYLTVCLYV